MFIWSTFSFFKYFLHFSFHPTFFLFYVFYFYLISFLPFLRLPFSNCNLILSFSSLFFCQDELITVKLREAEANLSLKEMKARVQDLEETWDRHQEKQREWETNGKVSFI